MNKRLVSIICAAALFTQTLPTNAIATTIEDAFIKKGLNSEVDKDKSDSNSEESSSKDENETSQDNKLKEEELGLDKVKFNAYIDKTDQLLFSIGFDEKEKKFTVSEQSEKNISEETPEETMYTIKIFDKEQKEKFSVELKGKDTGNSEKLEPLKSLNYEVGDFIQITPTDSKDVLKITGNIQGDVDKQKEDYSDGIDNYDYIGNVRFQVEEDHLKTVYNEAPVINGLTDIEESENPMNDILTGISIKDDHDGDIDNSNIKTNLEQINENSLKVMYTVEDSWGRAAFGTRVISSEKSNTSTEASTEVNDSDLSEKANISTYTTTNNSDLSNVQINVGGITYAGGAENRFKLKFDVPSSSIKVIEQDGRLMSNLIEGDYFKFELYDKDMKLKESVTLLGRDKSTSDKLKKLNNLKYVVGDYISIWHAESSSKLKIDGYIETTNGSADNYADGIDEEHLINHRFKIENTGLKDVINTAPVISNIQPITISRGSSPNLWEGVQITDDKDTFTEENIKSGKLSVTVSDIDTSILGNHTVTYTATDAWGLTSTATRTVTVLGTNPIETKFIEVYKTNTEELAFKIGFDSVKKTYIVSDINEGGQIDSTTDSVVFKFRIFSKDGILKKTVNIKGKDILNSSLLSKINGFKYDDEDYIELWSSNPKEGLKITGEIENTVSEEISNGVEVNIDNGIPENYGDGIDNIDYMKNVRFKIKSEGIEAVYNKAPIFNFENKTVIRGETIENLLDGVTVEDDHDKYSVEDLKNKVSYGSLNTDKVGQTTVDYRITDSWGRTTIATRTITVTDKNLLETQKINVKSNGKVIFSLSFDSILKKFIVNDINLENLDDNISGDIFRMGVYGPKTTRTVDNIEANLEKKSEVTITSDDLQNNKFTSKFEDLSFEENYYISLWSYNYENGIEIKLGGSENNSYLFEDDEKMNNTRFKITESGLTKKYNEEPEISGIETKYIFKGNGGVDFNPLEGVSANDDIDGTIQTNNIVYRDLDEFDKDTVGDYLFEYEVHDSWGRSTIQRRTVRVISKSVSNTIELYDNGNQKIFSLRYNPDRGRFDVTKENITTIGFRNSQDNTNSGESSNTVGDSSQSGDNTSSSDNESTIDPEQVVFKLSVFNSNSEKIDTIEIKNSELQDSSKLNEISNLDIQDDYYFNVWAYDHNKLRIQGELLGDSNNKKEEYNDGISNDDNMENVRFRVTQAGFECVYNNKPAINGVKLLEIYAGDEVDYLSHISVSDDHDIKIDNSKIKITTENGQPLDNKNDEGKLTIGSNTIKYTVEDSWGRESTETTTLNIKDGMGKNVIKLQGGRRENENVDRLNIGFNTDNNTLKITKVNSQFNPGMSNRDIYYKITIANSNGQNYFDPITVYGPNNPNDAIFNNLNNYTFHYGDKIKIFAWHPYRVKIDGKVIDAREDYTDGFDIPMNLLNAEFEITHSGLKSVYTETVTPSSSQTNIFAPIAPEGYPMKYAVIPEGENGGKLHMIDRKAYSILFGEGDNQVLKIAIYDQNGNLRRYDDNGNIVENGRKEGQKIYTGRDNGSMPGVGDYFNDFKYKNGDYLFIQHKYSKRIAVYGNVANQKEDYSDGFENEIDMRNTIFRFTSTGLEAVYNEAPTINGIEDKIIYLGDNFDPMEGVSVSQNEDSISTNETPVVSGDTVNIAQVGEYNLIYTVRDNWGRVTTKTRKVTVVPRLNDNRFKVYADTENNIIMPIESETTESNTNIDSSVNTKELPVFEIGFDPFTSMYKVYNQRQEKLSEYYLDEEVFSIVIYGSNNRIKESVTLLGNDRGTSPKLNVINQTRYEYGDTIKIYRANYVNGIKISGNITGDLRNENYSEGIIEMDNMNNTRFEVSQEGLKAIYNNAPQISVDSTLEEGKTVIKGNTGNLLEGISLIENDKHNSALSQDDISIYLEDQKISKDHVFDKIGKYTLNYFIVDKWGRSCLKQIKLSVESRVNLNDINVYHNDSIGLKIGFDTKESKIVVKAIEQNDRTSSDNNITDNTNIYFSMTVRDRKGNVKYSISLNGDREHDKQELAKIHNQSYSRYDSISVSALNPNTVKFDGDVVNESTDYTNGFGNIAYSDVRFIITDDGLKEIQQYVPTLNGLDKINIKRGEDVDFMKGVSANMQDSSDEDYTITVNQNEFDKFREGTYTIIYNVTTSWGVNQNYKRVVEVEPRTELEKVKMMVNSSISDGRTQNILTIGYDSINHKLRVINHVDKFNMPGDSSEVALRLTAYNELGNTIGSIELNGKESINENFITRINNFEYHEGYSLSIWYSDYRNLSIKGSIEDQKINYANGVTKADFIENVRFTIKENGLKSVYNEAPIINGCEEELIYYKGQILEPFNGLSVDDDHDENIDIYDINYDDSDVDFDTLGRYTIRYTVEDSWGRKSKVYERDIFVKSGLALNSIEVHSVSGVTQSLGNENNRVFGIGFEEGIVKINDRQDIQIDSNHLEDKVLSIKICNKSMEIVRKIELNGGDTGYSEKLNDLNNYRLNSDEFLSIEDISEEFASNGIKITGTVLFEKENFENGIHNIEEFKDTKFKLTEYGLESVYNTAPEISFDGTLNALLGDDIDYMKGVTIKDDHDKLDKDSVEITEPTEFAIGNNEVTYTVTDLWGKSTTKTRTVNLENALPNNTIEFMGHRNESNENAVEVALKMKFDITDMRIKVFEGKDIYFRKNNKENIQYKVQVLDKNGQQVALGQAQGNDKANHNGLITQLNDRQFEYGYKIKLFAWHQDLLRIQGPVRGAKEDYSDGVQQGDSYTSATFEITEKGLVATYEEDSSLDSNRYVTILPSAREGYPFALRINLQTKRIEAINHKAYSIEYGTNDKALEIILYNSEGDIKRTLTMRGNQNPKADSEAVNELNGSFVTGDYIKIYHRTPKNLAIRGNKTLLTGTREDYSDGIDDIENMNNLLLKLKDDHVEAVYVEPPTIEGIEDKIFFKGDNFNESELSTGVTATDPIEGPLRNITITNNISKDSNGKLNKIGLYDVRYTATNSQGLSNTVTSTVEVQAKPVITVNNGKNIVELDSVENNTKSIEKYLKEEVVTVTDEEDDAKHKKVNLDIEGTFNPSKDGSRSTIKYTATDSHGNQTTKTVDIQVVRTINVTVPTKLPFQIVTNLIPNEDGSQENDQFVSGVLKLRNNNTSPVKVSVVSFAKKENSGELEIVDPNSCDWDNMSNEDSMKKLALGIYIKDNSLTDSDYEGESNPLWLVKDKADNQDDNELLKKSKLEGKINAKATEEEKKSNAITMINQKLGVLPRRESRDSDPAEASIGFTSKHGKNFIGGSVTGKFELIFKFE